MPGGAVEAKVKAENSKEAVGITTKVGVAGSAAIGIGVFGIEVKASLGYKNSITINK